MVNWEEDNRQLRRGTLSRTHAAILVFTIVCIAIAYAFVVGGNLQGWIEWLKSTPETIRDMGWTGQLAIIGLMILHCFVPFPAEFVALTAGSLYGTFIGTLLTWLGAMVGAMISFGLTRILGQPFIDWALPEKQKTYLDKWTEDQGAMTLLISRFIPVIAFNLINIAAGLTRISWWTFIWTTGVGILPLTTLMVYMGSQMRELSWPLLATVSAVCIVLMAMFHWMKRKRKEFR